MGIDIYAKWRGQTEAEEKAQLTGYATDAGNVGYLREAYHGSPYVTKYFLKEAFGVKDDVKIPAKVLIERLPVAVLMSLHRNKKLYDDEKDPGTQSFGSIADAIKNVFDVEMKDESHNDFEKSLTHHHIEYAKARIASGDLPYWAKSYVDFAYLCEKKEKETGEPVTIICSA